MVNRDLLEGISGEDAFAGSMAVNEPMSSHTTLRIGGLADMFAMPGDIRSLKNLLAAARGRNLPVMPLGGGSNLLVADSGIEGLVVSMLSLNYIDIFEERNDAVMLYAGAGTPLQKLINLVKDRGYKGIEGLVGIPGSVGGAIRGNAGSFGFEIGDVVKAVTVIDNNGDVLTIEGNGLNFSYRSSSIHNGDIVVSATIILEKDDVEGVSRRIRDFFQEKLNRQPISEHSAGCVFKNPPGNYAARLIDEAQCKGMRRGDIEVSAKHANFFINTGNGKASDFMALMEDVRGKVLKAFGIGLEPEIKTAGRFNKG